MMTDNVLSNRDLLDLEKALREKLRPVTPDQKFIGSLRRQLEQTSEQDQERRLAASFLTIAGGLIMGLIIFLIGRIFMHDSGEK
jgi:hypothetical protein